MTYEPIANYGVIGDLHTVALVGMTGSIDFLSFPHFDSPTVFAALLDRKKGGHFLIAPTDGVPTVKQQYLPDTNILMTRFLSRHGVAELIDFMPVQDSGHAHTIFRRVHVVRGKMSFSMQCAPRFDYGRSGHRTEGEPGEVLFVSAGQDKTALRLRGTVPLAINGGDATADFSLNAGQTADFVLAEATDKSSVGTQLQTWCDRAFESTLKYWRDWIARSRYRGRWKEMVDRSALTLKLLTSQAHGSIVAAPTFGLPEEMGGERNWDYRYTWIRDSSFTLYGLLRLGFVDEASAFMKWLVDRCREPNPDGSLQIMYGIDGRHELTEQTLSHFEGYGGSAPVRIGNGAYDQMQLDIYGELMDSVYLYDKFAEPISYELWGNLINLVEWVRANWRGKDEGIWEVRGGKQEFLYSRLMCWVAIDRALRLSNKRSLPCDFRGWMQTRNEIFREIHEGFWNEQRKTFVQTKGGTNLDAACLLMPLVRFISPTDPRWLSTLDAIGAELVEDTLVYRYKVDAAASDGLAGDEGTFSMCSFWYIECLARAGRLNEARLAFEKMLGFSNHLGLYAEELGCCGEHLGNFPQAFTHLGLISAAFQLDRALSDRGWRA